MSKEKAPVVRKVKGGMKYIYYKKDHWFILHSIVMIFYPFTKSYCCPYQFREAIRSYAGFAKVGGKVNIRLERHVKRRVAKKEERNPPIKLYEDHKREIQVQLEKGTRCSRCYGLWDIDSFEKGRVLELIDFQSIHTLVSVLDNDQARSISEFMLHYSHLCKTRGSAKGKLEARSALTQRDKANIAASQEWKCASCGDIFEPGSRYEIDHRHSVYLGGSNDTSNLQALCSKCHSEKTDHDLSYPLMPVVDK